MQTIDFNTLAEDVRNLSDDGPGRARLINRLIDLQASSEAAVALQSAASRTLDDVLRYADGVLADRGLLADDEARAQLKEAVTSPEFRNLLPLWIRELRQVASARPDTGACTIASALELWGWTLKNLDEPEALDELSEALAPLIAARCLVFEAASQKKNDLAADLSQVWAARASSLVGATCAELVFGYRRHLTWDADGCSTCYTAEQLDELEAVMPGIAGSAGIDVIEANGSHPSKRGPCVKFEGVDTFIRLRNKLDGCLTGARLAKQRAAASIANAITKAPSEVGA